MAAHWITECPHCGTSFRVSEQHLRAAKGSVRCGSCLQIFNAIDTLFPSEETETTTEITAPAYSPITPPPDTPTPTPFIEEPDDDLADTPTYSIEVLEPDDVAEASDEQPNSRQQWEDEQEQFTDESDSNEPATNKPTAFSSQWEDDDHDYLADFDTPDITAPELDAPLLDAPDLEDTLLEKTTHMPWNYAENEDYLTSDKFDPTEDDFTDDVSTDDDLTDIEEKGELTHYETSYGKNFDDEELSNEERGDEELDDEELGDEKLSNKESFHEEAITDTIAVHTEAADSFDETDFIVEPESETVIADDIPSPASSTTPPSYDDDILLVGGSHVPNQYALQSEDVYQSRRDDERGHDWQILFDEHEPHIGPYRAPFRDELLSELEAEPPRGFQWHEANTPLRTKLLWVGINVLLVLALCIQYVLFHYSDFAQALQKPPFNTLIDTLCKTSGCRFIKTDISLVSNENLIVRVHPTQEGFIVLDTMMTNRAPFEQPFPSLDLSFSDIKDNIIARRIFKPAEYMSGDLVRAAAMPVNTPLHISFAIKNPSESATNYRLKLIPGYR